MRTHGRVRPLVLAATIGVVVLAGCSSGKSSSLKSAPGASSSPASPTTAAPAGLQAATNAKLGAILTDATGMTLYRNTKEEGGTIACTGGCTSIWSPLLLATGSSLPVAGAGVTGAVATVSRPDGGTQVTFNGAPLYHYSGDHQAGDATGQGIAGIWFVVSPAATAATATTTPSTTAAPTHTTIAPAHTAPTSPASPAPTAPKPSPTAPPPTAPKPTTPKPTTPPPTMPPPTTCAYPPCY